MCRSDWTALPILRSLWFKYTAFVTRSIQCKLQRGRGGTGGIDVTAHIEAMQKLARTLDSGVVGRGVLKMPVAGDVSRLPLSLIHI